MEYNPGLRLANSLCHIMRIRLGTRGSPLALWQANWVAARLSQLGHEVELVEIRTGGDQRLDAISGLNAQGLFTKEIQDALLDKRVDLAVHSLKDLPTEAVPDLALAAVPERETTADALVSREGKSFAELAKGATIGTGSARRRAQLLHARGDLVMADIRGNVDTRLRKLREGQYDAIVLAQAGLRRLELEGEITEILPTEIVLPAVGQGALGLETRADDAATRGALAALNHADSHSAVLAERALLAALRGGCLAPVGALAEVETSGSLSLRAVVLSVDGVERIAASGATEGPPDREAARALGEKVAAELLAQGASELIASARRF